jgi:hypothetical protein
MLRKRRDDRHQTIYRHIYLCSSYQPACGCHSQAGASQVASKQMELKIRIAEEWGVPTPLPGGWVSRDWGGA